MNQKKILLAVAIASTGMIFATGCGKKPAPQAEARISSPDAQAQAREATFALAEQIMSERLGFLATSQTQAVTTSYENEVKTIDGQIKAKQEKLAQLSTQSTKEAIEASAAASVEITALETEKSEALTVLNKQREIINTSLSTELAKARTSFESQYNEIFAGRPKTKKNADGEKEIVKDKDGNVVYVTGHSPVDQTIINHVTLGFEAAQVAVEGRKTLNGMADESKLHAAETRVEGLMLDTALANINGFVEKLNGVRNAELTTLGIKDEALVSKKAAQYVREQFSGLAAQVMNSQVSFASVTGAEVHPCESCAVVNASTQSNVGHHVTEAIKNVLAARAEAERLAGIASTEEAVRTLLKGTKEATDESVQAAFNSINRIYFSLDSIRTSIEAVSNRAELTAQETVNQALLANTL